MTTSTNFHFSSNFLENRLLFKNTNKPPQETLDIGEIPTSEPPSSEEIQKTKKTDTDFPSIETLLREHQNIAENPDRANLREHALVHRECIETKAHALATWTPPESTGRSPNDTFIVEGECSDEIDWTSPNNIPLEPEIFDGVVEEAAKVLKQKENLFVINCMVGADAEHAMPVKIITDKALTSLFAYNMFWPVPDDMDEKDFNDEVFTLVALPKDKVDSNSVVQQISGDSEDSKRDMIIAMDLDRKMGIVYGSEYLGSVKKTIFTVMNHYLPKKGILSLHCGAYENDAGETTLMLGLSGTGKTTLSMDPERAIIGDDEFGWSKEGIFNMEAGNYAKAIGLDPEEEPVIWDAICDARIAVNTIIENAMIFPNGELDLNDTRLTPNSRASFPLSALGDNAKQEAVGNHPKTMVFLTADASGVLPPISKLTPKQAMLWFCMGYTSKLAGTETGIDKPIPTFSRFFGQPFMPGKPEVYSDLLAEKLEEHGTQVFIINTGWTGGPYGEGHRIDIENTRAMLRAAETGQLDNVEYREDPRFHVSVPLECPGVDSAILNPKSTWEDEDAYEEAADTLAGAFSEHFDKTYGQANFDDAIKKSCPGK